MGKGLTIREFSPFASLIDDFFNESWPVYNQRHDVKVTDSGYEWRYELPGVKADDLSVEIRDGRLHIKAEKKFEKEAEGRKYHVRERQFGQFERSFRLPEGADWDKADAQLKEGVLTINVAKRPEEKPKKISVR